MDTILNVGLISDDSVFGAELSSYFIEDRKYFPVLSLPRMTRIDWEFEVSKRATSINRVQLDLLFCKSADYAMLAPLRNQINTDIVAIETARDIFRYIPQEFPDVSLKIARDDYLYGLITAKTEKKILEITEVNFASFPHRNPLKPNSETVVVLETTNQITDISAINYAFAKGYDILLIEPIAESEVKDIESLFSSQDGDDATLNQLRNRCQNLINFDWIEGSYKEALLSSLTSLLDCLLSQYQLLICLICNRI